MADAHRGQGDAADRPLLRRPADEVPLRRGTGARAGRGIRCRSSATQLRDAGVLTESAEARSPPRSRPRSTTRPTTPNRSRIPTVTAMPGVYAEDRPGGDAGAALMGRRPLHRRSADRWRRTFIEAIRETLAEEMRRDPSIIVLGEDVGREGRRVPGHRRAVRRVRRRPGHRHAADRVDDRGRLDRRRRQRAAAGRRDPVRRLHLPGLQPDRVRGGPDALPVEQRVRRARSRSGPRSAAASTARCTTRSRSRRSSPTCRG